MKKIDKSALLNIVKVGAFVVTIAASVATGWVESENMKGEVAKQVSEQIKSLPQ